MPRAGASPSFWPSLTLWPLATRRNKPLQRGSVCTSCTSEDSCELTCVVTTAPAAKLECSTPQHSVDEKHIVLDAVIKLLTEPKYNDVLFITRDGKVQANRAYLAARCGYFESLLYGPHKEGRQCRQEGSLASIHLPHASSAALRHVLQYLHSGQLPTHEHSWRVLVEACSLSQQYLLPEVLSHTTQRLLAQLTPANLGPCLSYALQEGLDPVVKKLWLAIPGLMHKPASFHGFSAAAVGFCLDHSCCSMSIAARAQSADDGTAGANVSHEPAAVPPAAEQGLFLAVMQWCKEAAGACEACCSTSNSTPTGGDHTSSHISLRSGTWRTAAACTSPNGSAGSGGELQAAQCAGPVLCEEHQRCLEAFLSRLNWQHLGREAMEHVEGLQLLSQHALLQVYRAQANTLHAAIHGTFMLCDGMRVRLRQGSEVLECSSIQHITVASGQPLTTGLHCWEVRCHVACSLTWVGVTDGTVHGDGWGGKQPGGFFYGCNDALCNASSSEQRPGASPYLGHGPWGDGSVLQFFLDMDERELWIGVDGARPKRGFKGLPAAGVYPAVSVRAPAQLHFAFRPSSWCRAQDVFCLYTTHDACCITWQ